MMKSIYTLPPYLNSIRAKILPVFIPFAGCPQRCIYCSQTLQTGEEEDSQEYIYQKTELELKLLEEKYASAASFDVDSGMDSGMDSGTGSNTGPHELAFYGGTFTALPIYWQEKWLDLARTYKKSGLISRVRSSTRPDSVNYESLLHLKALGLDTVELGIQSFDDNVLKKSCRGYTGASAKAAAKDVSLAGMSLVLQLMPGLPASTPLSFMQDVHTTIDLAPEAARIYPCLVLKGTPLAKMWQLGDYCPWGLEETSTILSEALPLFWQANIPVIRIGVAAEDNLLPNILAGPWHPSLGSRVQATALFYWIKNTIATRSDIGGKLLTLTLPKYLQGTIWGDKGTLKQHYANLGVYPQNTTFWNWPVCRFETN